MQTNQELIRRTILQYMPGADGEADAQTIASAVTTALSAEGRLIPDDAETRTEESARYDVAHETLRLPLYEGEPRRLFGVPNPVVESRTVITTPWKEVKP